MILKASSSLSTALISSLILGSVGEAKANMRESIRAVLRAERSYSCQLEQLLLATAAIESQLGEESNNVFQITRQAWRTVSQTERPPELDGVKAISKGQREERDSRFSATRSSSSIPGSTNSESRESDERSTRTSLWERIPHLAAQIRNAALIYLSTAGNAIFSAKTPQAQAALWKRFFNTASGAGTVSGFLRRGREVGVWSAQRLHCS